MKKYAAILIPIIAIIIGIFLLILPVVHAEEIEEAPEEIIFYVIRANLNARISPNRHSYIVTTLERGQEIHGTGRWSKDHRWVEIDHSEYGKLWCAYQYLTERLDEFEIETLWDEPIKIRKQAVNGSVCGKLRKNKTVTITQVVLGWGKCKQGWIDLSYCIEIEE